MRVTFVCPTVAQNGGSRVVAIYATELLARGHDVTVVARKPASRTLKQKIMNPFGAQASPNHSAFFDELGDRFIEVDRSGPLLPEDVPDADVVIATWWRTAFEVATFPAEKGQKLYFVQHHEVYSYLPWDLSAGSYYLPLKKITIAQWLVDTMAQNYGDTDVALVPNSVDHKHFRAPKRDKNTHPTVGLMYSPAAFKGVDIALEAIDLVRQKIPNVQVIAFGQTAVKPHLPLPRGAIYHRDPAQSEIPEIYASCDAWIFSSRSEGFGLPILEAMACRTPVVATRAGAAPDFIKNGENGFIVEIDDSTALAHRLVDVLQRAPEDWQSMSEAAFQGVQSYSWGDATAAFEAALQECVRSQ